MGTILVDNHQCRNANVRPASMAFCAYQTSTAAYVALTASTVDWINDAGWIRKDAFSQLVVNCWADTEDALVKILGCNSLDNGETAFADQDVDDVVPYALLGETTVTTADANVAAIFDGTCRYRYVQFQIKQTSSGGVVWLDVGML